MTPTTLNIELVRARRYELARASERRRSQRRPRARRASGPALFTSKHVRLWRRRLQPT
jgi:predicted alpha/beta-hydrolase family hydrolase